MMTDVKVGGKNFDTFDVFLMDLIADMMPMDLHSTRHVTCKVYTCFSYALPEKVC